MRNPPEIPDPPHKAIFDCNPKSQRHWLYKAGILRQNPETGERLPDADAWSPLHWAPHDNPYLTPDYLTTLEAMPGAQRRRMLDGVWCEGEGAVYSEFYDYAWQPAAEGRNDKEVPLKDRDHAMDPLRYMIMKLDSARGGGLAIPGHLPGG